MRAGPLSGVKSGLLLFDLDGVLLDETRYLDAAAVTVALLSPRPTDRATLLANCRGDLPDAAVLYSREPQGVASETDVARVTDLSGVTGLSGMDDVARLRSLWLPDPVVSVLRQRAQNSNWDKAWACLLALWATSSSELREVLWSAEGGPPPHFGDALQSALMETPGQGAAYLEEWAQRAPMAPAFDPVQAVFQMVFHGDRVFDSPVLRDGLCSQEQPKHDPSSLRQLQQNLMDRGWVLGIGTGRPRREAHTPLARSGLWDSFSPPHVCTWDEVCAEANLTGCPPGVLGKPHPFTFLRAAAGFDPARVWVVGDSPADRLAAEAAGFHFVAVAHEGAPWTDGVPSVPSVLMLL